MKTLLRDSSIQDLTLLSGGKGVSYTCRMGVVAKKMDPAGDSPYELFNEVVGATLASLCGLPALIPTIFLHDKDVYTVTPFVVTSDETTPPPIEREIRRRLDREAQFLHGMIVIDVWLGNNDRKADNILYGLSSKEAYLIDYGNSLLYRGREKGIERLEALSRDASLFDSEKKPYRYKDMLKDESLVREWAEKIRSIPAWMIKGIISEGAEALSLVLPDVGVENINVAVWKFLQNRRDEMENLIIDMAARGTFNNYRHTTKGEVGQ
jgi:hypothetical protein